MDRPCKFCGNLLVGVRPNQHFCGRRCSKEHNRNVHRGKTPALDSHTELTTDPIAIAYLAGVFEGEGCVHILRRTTNGIRYAYASTRVAMTDRDVIEKCHSLSGIGSMFGPFKPNKGDNYKDQWVWSVSAKKDVRALCAAMWPHLGLRRRTRINEILTEAKLEPIP